jgi:hypothetical protein
MTYIAVYGIASCQCQQFAGKDNGRNLAGGSGQGSGTVRTLDQHTSDGARGLERGTSPD